MPDQPTPKASMKDPIQKMNDDHVDPQLKRILVSGKEKSDAWKLRYPKEDAPGDVKKIVESAPSLSVEDEEQVWHDFRVTFEHACITNRSYQLVAWLRDNPHYTVTLKRK